MTSFALNRIFRRVKKIEISYGNINYGIRVAVSYSDGLCHEYFPSEYFRVWIRIENRQITRASTFLETYLYGKLKELLSNIDVFSLLPGKDVHERYRVAEDLKRKNFLIEKYMLISDEIYTDVYVFHYDWVLLNTLGDKDIYYDLKGYPTMQDALERIRDFKRMDEMGDIIHHEVQ